MESSNGQMEDIILEISQMLKCKDKEKCLGIQEMARKLYIRDNF